MPKDIEGKGLKFEMEPDRTAGEKKVKAEPTRDRMKLYKVKVLRLNVDRDNADLPIHVASNDRYGNRPKQFFPNTEVYLTDSELNVLRDSAQEDYIEIPGTSGIYQSPNPLGAAEAQFPGFKARWGRTGVVLEKRTPNFAVEILDTVILPVAGLISANVGRAIVEGGDPDFRVVPKAVDRVVA